MMDGLFDAAPYSAPGTQPGEQISADRRRTLAQQRAITLGQHPLRVPVHPDANGRTATKDNAADRPIRCGTCIFREHVSYKRSYPKCMWTPDNHRAGTAPPRFSHSAASDVRSWWPGCTNWKAATDDAA